ncbi:hypothetical protein D3C86_1430320 [compost metagenome]
MNRAAGGTLYSRASAVRQVCKVALQFLMSGERKLQLRLHFLAGVNETQQLPANTNLLLLELSRLATEFGQFTTERGKVKGRQILGQDVLHPLERRPVCFKFLPPLIGALANLRRKVLRLEVGVRPHSNKGFEGRALPVRELCQLFEGFPTSSPATVLIHVKRHEHVLGASL